MNHATSSEKSLQGMSFSGNINSDTNSVIKRITSHLLQKIKQGVHVSKAEIIKLTEYGIYTPDTLQIIKQSCARHNNHIS